MKLVIFCVECGERIEAPFEDQRLLSRQLFKETGWVLSVVDPKAQVLAPLCGPCTEKVYPPELLAEIKRMWLQ